MTALLMLLAVAAVWAAGVVAYRYFSPSSPTAEAPAAESTPEAGCGLSGMCTLSCAVQLPPDAPLYYDDEHLDAFRGRPADAYTPAEVDTFDDVLTTLQPADAHGWLHSLQQRGIELPAQLRDAALMLVGNA